ncbi:MAG: hypothetical protein EB015_19370, partial [Methylocystaceae bacterium]|nr:hypothetical protein [Methylocystaceae bacterium]
TLLPNIDATKVKWSISDSAANIAAAFAAKSDTVTKATSLAFTTSMTIDSAKTILAGAKTKLPTAGALAISDSVKNIVDASKSSDAATNLTALIAKGFSINISDSAANIAGSDGAFADIDSLIGKIADIKLDDGNSKTDNDAVFAYGTKLADHANTIGHIVDSYSVAKDTSSSGEGP